jgi:hypothetical protein
MKDPNAVAINDWSGGNNSRYIYTVKLSDGARVYELSGGGIVSGCPATTGLVLKVTIPCISAETTAEKLSAKKKAKDKINNFFIFKSSYSLLILFISLIKTARLNLFLKTTLLTHPSS